MSDTPTDIPGYSIQRELGAGGMARVYLARQLSFDRPVALKVISSQLAGNPEFKRRFLREARIVGRLSHPHIVPVYDVGEHGGVFYLAMELFTGGDLRQRMHNPLSESMALDIARQLASALGYAHDKGFVHRDIKPDNVLFRESGEAVLTDFGIARPAHGQRDLTEITQVESIIGSPRYMSPEQSMGQPLDGRSDIYSLGVMLYQMLVGEVPFPGPTPAELSIQRRDNQPPSLPPRLAHLQPLLDGMLAYQREQRFADCRALLAALSTAQASSGRQAGTADSTTVIESPGGTVPIAGLSKAATLVRHPAFRWSGAALAAALGALALLLVLSAEEPAGPARDSNVSGAAVAQPASPSVQADGPEPADSEALEIPPAGEFFAFYDAVNSGLPEIEKSFVQAHPDSTLAQILRLKLRSDPAAFDTLFQHADRGVARAQLIASELLDTGWAGQRDPARAREYAAQAASSGNPFAEYHYATLLLNGARTDSERRRGLQLLEQSAAQGFYLAQTVLANHLLEGRLLDRDIPRGLALLEAAGEQGDRHALFNLGKLLDTGLYVEQADPARARRYFKRAGELGLIQAKDYLNEP